MRVGVISDTHGLLREEALAALAGVDRVVHAGDVGRLGLLEELGRVAPVTAVWGNVDGPELRSVLPEVARVELAGATVVVAHHAETALRAASQAAALVVFGHSHKASVERRDQLVLLNPGSAGPRRFRLPVSLALVTLATGGIEAEIVELVVGTARDL
jgi:putative phosphoesterase